MLRTYEGVLHVQIPYTVDHTEKLLRELQQLYVRGALAKKPVLKSFYEDLRWQCDRAHERNRA